MRFIFREFSEEIPSLRLGPFKRLYSLAENHNESVLLIEACHALACTLCFLGEFVSARQYAMSAIQTWRSEGVQPAVEEVDVPVTSTLSFAAISEWHLGEIPSCRATIAEAISLAKRLNDTHGLVVDLVWAAILGYCERDPAEVERLASEVIELSTRHQFAHYLAVGAILRAWARSVSGNTTEGIASIEDGIRNYRATGAMLAMPVYLALKAEALYLLDRTSEALEAIKEAEALERTGERHWRAEHHRLRGVLLAAMGAEEKPN
jgi:hypothetical protein